MTHGSDFARLSRVIQDAGLLDRRPAYYALRLSLVALAFAGGWAAFVSLGDSWWQLLVAIVLAIAFAQVALIAHDLAHRQVFRTRRASAVAGRIAGNLGVGMSYGWWMDKHTRHHANPNHEDHDPDVDPSLLVWSEDQAARAGGLSRFIAKWEAYLFFPLLTLEAWNLHVSSVRALSRLRDRRLETVLLLAHFVWYFALVFTVLPAGKAIVFVLVQKAVFGVYLGCTFAPNHKGMPVLTGADSYDYLRKQVLTSRNVRGGRFIDVLLGGLNYQIEHHLFPSMPTPNLRKAQPLVRAHCDALGISYAEAGLFESYGIALRHMHAIGARLRAKPASEPVMR
ncbi:fatty acid desaturase family protein [Nonomuraea sp. NPDC050663]|uniref:fatty acid desaturase family protein n=1 Tax=Nonomuraea sp. NPDC050663 TaxID=3364370 RepID=UPI0037879F6D